LTSRERLRLRASETIMQEMRGLSLLFVGAALVGCSSVGGSTVRTGKVDMPAYTGPVAIYPTGHMPAGTTDLGIVEVHALQDEATVETLLPQFVRRVAAIGGNVAVIDGIRARFEIVGRTHVETFYYTCGLGGTCAGTRVYAANDEVMIVSMFGHAGTTQPTDGAPLLPGAPSPLSPAPDQVEPPPDEPLPSDAPHPPPRGPDEPM
jgi:hypothetical protein